MEPSTKGKTYAVTGAASGIGRATAQLLSRTARVFAMDVNAEGLATLASASPQLVPVKVDLTHAASVEEATRRIGEQTSGLDGLVNCAGLNRYGAMVELPDEEFRAVMDVNVLGTYRATKALFPLLKARLGRIVVVSSEMSTVSAPFDGVYSMSKYALEAYSDALRRELALLGMKVAIIQPGPVKTALLQDTVPGFDRAIASSQFAQGMRAIRDMASKEWEKSIDPAEVAEVVERALTSPRPALRYKVGNDLSRAAAKLLPGSWLDAVMVRVMKG
ncbi:MAG TPA: SDR family NAD(P)-dependent oxidoreductase [Myxococcales bacterium]|jgi:NAD(P)-dependent dehydrogenase (short-subunit alcohol dehydrogenase family)